jgi:hypothetical protein
MFDVLAGSMDSLEAQIVVARLAVARCGQTDAFGWWASRLWVDGHRLLASTFIETWPRQRILLTLLEARAAEDTERDRSKGDALHWLFHLDPDADAKIDRIIAMLPLKVAVELGRVVDVQSNWKQTLSSVLAECESDLVKSTLATAFAQSLKAYRACADTGSWPPLQASA